MEYDKQAQLKGYNSFRTDAVAKLFCQPQNVEQIQQCLKDYPEEQKLVIGGGCNLFFTKDFNGLVIHPNIKGLREISDDEDEDETVFLEVNSSEDWDEFVAFCVEKGYWGLENLSLIPGTVGASPVQNIGAYGAEVKDCIHEVIAVDMNTGEVISFSNAECEFGYRDSVFKRTNKYIIVSVVFNLKRQSNYQARYKDLNKELEESENPTLKEIRDAVIRIRQRKLPDEKELPNAGSFFKNPTVNEDIIRKIQEEYPDIPAFPQSGGMIKTSAAFLIDKAGLKGMRIGEIGTYPNQPLIVVNYGSNDGNDIVNFMKEIQAGVKNKFGIELEPEVRIF